MAKLFPMMEKLFWNSLAMLRPYPGETEKQARYRKRRDILEASWPVAYGEASQFIDGMLLCLPAWQREPDALSVAEAHLGSLEYAELQWYHGRALWVDWPVMAPDFCDDPANAMRASYLAAAVARVDAEAWAKGASDSFLDAEPHGASCIRDFWGNVTTPQERAAITEVVQAATASAGKVAWFRPPSSQGSGHRLWIYRMLGDKFLDSKTYKVRTLADLKIIPPDGHPIKMDAWGVYLTLDAANPDGRWLVSDLPNLPVDAIQAAFPECHTLWFYCEAEERLEVMYALGKMAQELPT